MKIQFLVARSCFAVFMLAVGNATPAAQPTKPPNPADPGVAAPPVKYDSAFSEYQPFREQQIRPWKEVNKEVADNPAMGSMGSMKHGPGKEPMAGHDMASMKAMPGKTMPGMDKQAASAPKSKEAAVSHDMGAMKDMPGKTMPGMDKQAASAPKSKEAAASHDMGAMKDMPGKAMPGMDKKASAARKGKDGAAHHDMGAMKDTPGKGALAMAKPQTAGGQPSNARSAGITGTGVVQAIDKANGKVKLTHDPIAALDWPRMTVFFRLKDKSLTDQVKEGDKVEFSLEKSTSGYVISGLQKVAASHDMKQMK